MKLLTCADIISSILLSGWPFTSIHLEMANFRDSYFASLPERVVSRSMPLPPLKLEQKISGVLSLSLQRHEPVVPFSPKIIPDNCIMSSIDIERDDNLLFENGNSLSDNSICSPLFSK